MTISTADFEFVREMIKRDAAIALETGKEYLVDARLSSLARQEGFASVNDLVTNLRTSKVTDLAYKVTEAMTTNETSFFRDITPFEALRDQVIPQLMAKRATQKSLRIWCAAASTGQEPYSLAMLLRDHFPELSTWRVQIVATDISREVLAKARTGIYTQLEVNRGLPAASLVKHFERDGANWRVKKPLRDMIDYRELNLIGNWSGVTNSDIVLMRNVLIYFEVATKKSILANVRRNMQPDGYLMLGSAETTMNIDDQFKRVAVGKSSCYQITGA